MRIQTLTDRLHEQSDKKLKERLRSVFKAARHEFTDGCTKPISVIGGYIQGTDNQSKVFTVDGHAALSALEELAFNMQRDECRNKEVEEFMSKVSELNRQYNELSGVMQDQ